MPRKSKSKKAVEEETLARDIGTAVPEVTPVEKARVASTTTATQPKPQAGPYEDRRKDMQKRLQVCASFDESILMSPTEASPPNACSWILRV